MSKLKFIEFVKHCINVSDKVCVTCAMAKFTKLPFQMSESHIEKPFELIHTDIWGPYRVCTRCKFKYFLTIVGDISRMTWIYLLQHKSEYSKSLKLFHYFAPKQFGCVIQIMRFDNACKFNDAACKKKINNKALCTRVLPAHIGLNKMLVWNVSTVTF